MTERLISSGRVQSQERMPEPRCATAIVSFAAARAAASAESSSPQTSTRSGCSSKSTDSKAVSVAAVRSAGVPPPMPSQRCTQVSSSVGGRTRGRGAGVDDDLAETAAPLERGDDGRHLDEAVVVGDRMHHGGVRQTALRRRSHRDDVGIGGVMAMPR